MRRILAVFSAVIGAAICAAAPVVPAQPRAGATAPFPLVTLTEEWRVTTGQGGTRGLSGLLAHVVAGPGGRVIAAPGPNGGDIFAVDSTGRETLWRVGVGRDPNLELRYVDRLGWSGATLWVSDPGYDHVVLIDAAGRVLRSIENPAFVRPRLRERGEYPVYEAMQPLARYDDGTMLIRPRHNRRGPDDAADDSTTTQFLRVSTSGVIESRVARFPPAPHASFAMGGQTVYRSVPFLHRTFWGVSPDGARLALATPVVAGPDSGIIRVVLLGERGDTTAVARVPVALTAVATKSRDSALARVTGIPGVAIQQVRDGVRRLMPSVHTPLTQLFVGRDRSVWIALAPARGDSGVRWLTLDARGAPLGSVRVPRGVTLHAADGARAWGIVRDSTRTTSLVQYRMSRPAQRTAR